MARAVLSRSQRPPVPAAARPPVKRKQRSKVLRPRSIRGIQPWPSDEAYDRLAAFYGEQEHRPRIDPTSELVWTILSQHTSDLNAGRAYEELRRRLPTWRRVLDAPIHEVADAIRGGGLAQQKAPRIQAVLHEVQARTGGLDIAFLAGLPLADAKAWLRSLPGVGPKTAGVVLSFALGMPAMAVDTHIHRVARRLGLIGPKVSADEAHDILEGSIAPERVFRFHIYLITHGRRVCSARRPLCGACVLAERCPSRAALATAGDARKPLAALRAKPL